MAIEEEPDVGIPEWVVTFGDMMSLLLTFFIMLVSMSEIKDEEKYQAMVESLRRQFGHESSMSSMVPGDNRPRNSRMPSVASMGRAKRAHTMKGGNKVKAPVGENTRVRVVRPGDQVTIGGVVYFNESDAVLSVAAKTQLQIAVGQIQGKPQKIEIRGHTSRKLPGEDSPFEDNWQLAYERCKQTKDFLIELGISPRRIRFGVAADNEPVYLGVDPKELQKNSRVEVVMINERVSDLEGAPGE